MPSHSPLSHPRDPIFFIIAPWVHLIYLLGARSHLISDSYFLFSLSYVDRRDDLLSFACTVLYNRSLVHIPLLLHRSAPGPFPAGELVRATDICAISSTSIF